MLASVMVKRAAGRSRIGRQLAVRAHICSCHLFAREIWLARPPASFYLFVIYHAQGWLQTFLKAARTPINMMIYNPEGQPRIFMRALVML